MRFKLILLFLLPIIVSSQQTIGVFLNNPESYDGLTLFNPLGSSTTYLIDNCGNKVYEWNSEYAPAASVYLMENGNLLRTNRLDSTNIVFGGSAGGIEILDPESNVLWNYENIFCGIMKSTVCGIMEKGICVIMKKVLWNYDFL